MTTWTVTCHVHILENKRKNYPYLIKFGLLSEKINIVCTNLYYLLVLTQYYIYKSNTELAI